MLVFYLHVSGDLHHPASLILVTQKRRKAVGDTQVRKMRRRMEVREVEGLERGVMLMTLTKKAEWVKRNVHIHKYIKFMNQEPVFYLTIKYLQMHKNKQEKNADRSKF